MATKSKAKTDKHNSLPSDEEEEEESERLLATQEAGAARKKWASRRSKLNTLLLILVLLAVCMVVVSIAIQSSSSRGCSELSISTSEKTEALPLGDPIFIPQTIDPNVGRRVRNSIVVSGNGDSPLKDCSVTSQVRIERYRTHWILQPIDSNGRNVTTGGDEFYVTYTGPWTAENPLVLEFRNGTVQMDAPTAVAIVTDHQDGTYRLDFVTTPFSDAHFHELPGSFGKVKVHFEYSCGIGRLAPPVKKDWHSSGSSEASYELSNVPRPPWRVFSPPSNVDLSIYDLVIAFGDSLMRHFVVGGPSRQERIFHRNKTDYRDNVGSALSLDTVSKFLTSLERFHGDELRSEARSVALILGSAVWDILRDNGLQGADFRDHLEACRQFILAVRAKYPLVHVYWKSPSALQIHKVRCRRDEAGCRSIVKYMSSSRAEYLYKHQMKVMRELDVPVLDVYEGTYLSAQAHERNDGRHFRSSFDSNVLDWFYTSKNTD